MYEIVKSLSGILYRRSYTCTDMSHVRHVHHVLRNDCKLALPRVTKSLLQTHGCNKCTKGKCKMH
jgi:hypothetical protein